MRAPKCGVMDQVEAGGTGGERVIQGRTKDIVLNTHLREVEGRTAMERLRGSDEGHSYRAE